MSPLPPWQFALVTPRLTAVKEFYDWLKSIDAALRARAVPFAGLPSPAVEGMLAAITDSTVNTWGTVIAGGGANHVLGYYNGTNWTVAAK